MKQKMSAVVDESRDDPEWLFPHGKVFWTPGVIREVSLEDVAWSLACHCTGDWGDIDPYDWSKNDLALEHGDRLFSAYHTDAGLMVWIITEADRSMTTVLLPEDY
jgi:hypothetical protein